MFEIEIIAELQYIGGDKMTERISDWDRIVGQDDWKRGSQWMKGHDFWRLFYLYIEITTGEYWRGGYESVVKIFMDWEAETQGSVNDFHNKE